MGNDNPLQSVRGIWCLDMVTDPTAPWIWCPASPLKFQWFYLCFLMMLWQLHSLYSIIFREEQTNELKSMNQIILYDTLVMSVCQIQMSLSCWSSTDCHQIVGDTITQKSFSWMCRWCIMATTCWGFCDNCTGSPGSNTEA